jgi:SAM-dependent methyltransferase
MTTIFYILTWISIIILFTVLVLFVVWMITGYRAKVPFIPVPDSILKDIHKILAVKEGSVVYDLGCGDGRVLFYIAPFIPKAKYIGIENSPFPLLLARARAWWHSKRTGTKIEIINQDFFLRDLSDATHIFTYLYPNVMDDLLPKLDKELKPGTRLVSASFKFTTKQPKASFDMGRGKYQLARKLYVYEF